MQTSAAAATARPILWYASTYQLGGSAIGCTEITERSGDDHCASDGRQQFGCAVWRESTRHKLIETHLEETLHFRRHLRRQVQRSGAKHCARAHALVGVQRCAECARPYFDR